MASASFRVYAELNDFLPSAWRWQEFGTACAPDATTKHMIEALGVPHTEVELILVNGQSVGFEYRLHDGDRVSVYPYFAALDIAPLMRIRQRARVVKPEPADETIFALLYFALCAQRTLHGHKISDYSGDAV